MEDEKHYKWMSLGCAAFARFSCCACFGGCHCCMVSYNMLRGWSGPLFYVYILTVRLCVKSAQLGDGSEDAMDTPGPIYNCRNPRQCLKWKHFHLLTTQICHQPKSLNCFHPSLVIYRRCLMRRYILRM